MSNSVPPIRPNGVMLEELRRFVLSGEAIARGDPASGPCPDDAALAALAEGMAEGAPPADLMAHVASCPHCLQTVASLSRALGDPRVAGEVRRLAGFRSGRLPWVGLGFAATAAAAILIVMLAGPGTAPVSTPMRESSSAAAMAPRPIAPVGRVGLVQALEWSGVTGAGAYRATLFDRQGTVLWRLETRDTVAGLPAAVTLRQGETYLWKVDARTSWGRWSGSALVEFTVAGAP